MKKKNLLVTALALCMTANFTFSACASSAPAVTVANTSTAAETCAQRRDPAQLSTEQIITELYANVNNAMIQDAAKTEAMMMTGEKEITTDKYGIYVGKYDTPTWPTATTPFGDLHEQRFVIYKHSDGTQTYVLYAPVSAIPDAQQMQKNKEMLNHLYNIAWDLKEQTASMNSHDKAVAVADWIRDNIKQGYGVSKAPVNCLADGKSDCSGYSALFEILGSFCGLNVKQVSGTLQSTPHTFNLVDIDGSLFYMDANWHEYLVDESTLLSHGYTITMISGENGDVLSSPSSQIRDFSK